MGVEAVRRDNICKTQCTFALNSPPPANNVVNDGTLTAPLPPPAAQRPPGPAPPRPQPGLPLRQLPPRPPLRSVPAGFTSSSPATFFPPQPAPGPGPATGDRRPREGPLPGPGVPVVPGPVAAPSGGAPVVSLGGQSGPVPVVVPAQVPGAGPVVVQPPGSLRQPRPLFNFPSIRLPNLSDLFGL